MKLALLAVLLVGLAAFSAFAACDDSTGEDCRTEECIVLNDAGGFPDGGAPFTPADDGGSTAPLPFDAGVPSQPTCKGLFELCSGIECCSPYGCTNGTCR